MLAEKKFTNAVHAEPSRYKAPNLYYRPPQNVNSTMHNSVTRAGGPARVAPRARASAPFLCGVIAAVRDGG